MEMHSSLRFWILLDVRQNPHNWGFWILTTEYSWNAFTLIKAAVGVSCSCCFHQPKMIWEHALILSKTNLLSLILRLFCFGFVFFEGERVSFWTLLNLESEKGAVICGLSFFLTSKWYECKVYCQFHKFLDLNNFRMEFAQLRLENLPHSCKIHQGFFSFSPPPAIHGPLLRPGPQRKICGEEGYRCCRCHFWNGFGPSVRWCMVFWFQKLSIPVL